MGKGKRGIFLHWPFDLISSSSHLSLLLFRHSFPPLAQSIDSLHSITVSLLSDQWWTSPHGDCYVGTMLQDWGYGNPIDWFDRSLLYKWSSKEDQKISFSFFISFLLLFRNHLSFFSFSMIIKVIEIIYFPLHNSTITFFDSKEKEIVSGKMWMTLKNEWGRAV